MQAEVLQILQYMFLRTFFVEGARTEFLLLDSKFSIGNMVGFRLIDPCCCYSIDLATFRPISSMKLYSFIAIQFSPITIAFGMFLGLER